MKIAFITLPHAEETIIAPPLAVGYIAALLEQQRHIVRIYDLALHDPAGATEALAPLRAFRPHLAVVATSDPAARALVEHQLAGSTTIVMPLGLDVRLSSPAEAMAQALCQIERRPTVQDEQSVIYEALLALDDDLDVLPFPARHLLSLEQYPLSTPAGNLQTTVFTGQQLGTDGCIPRNPLQIIAELRSITREYGIRHFIFSGPLLTADPAWFRELLVHLATSDLGIRWEGSVEHSCLTPELLRMCRRAGCEVLCLQLDANILLESNIVRAALSTVVAQAHTLDMAVRGQIQLDSQYAVMPALIDLAATFGLDDARFRVSSMHEQAQALASEDSTIERVAEMVQSRYRSSCSRQFFVDRFGPRMGPMLWRVGRAGLLGRTWQRHADGSDQVSSAVASGYSF